MVGMQTYDVEISSSHFSPQDIRLYPYCSPHAPKIGLKESLLETFRNRLLSQPLLSLSDHLHQLQPLDSAQPKVFLVSASTGLTFPPACGDLTILAFACVLFPGTALNLFISSMTVASASVREGLAESRS
jgi:hypothetical protein